MQSFFKQEIDKNEEIDFSFNVDDDPSPILLSY